MALGRSARFALLAALAALAPAAASSQPAPGGYGAVAVDVGPLRAKGLGPYAEVVRRTLEGELAAAFADRMAPGGPRLVVRVDALSQGTYVGGESRVFSGAIPNDYLEGEALVAGRRGEVLRRLPQMSVLPANSGGAWYDPASEGRRIVAVARHYAQWLRRRLD